MCTSGPERVSCVVEEGAIITEDRANVPLAASNTEQVMGEESSSTTLSECNINANRWTHENES